MMTETDARKDLLDIKYNSHPQQLILDSVQHESSGSLRYPTRKDTDPDEQMVIPLRTSG